MKKGIIVLLITVLAAGMVFADFSGDAYIQFNADLDNKNYGFANGTDFSFTFKVASEVAKIAGENPVHVELEATADLIVGDTAYQEETTGSGQDAVTKVKVNSAYLIWSSASTSKYGFGLVFNLKTAKIVGENWSIAINGAKSSAYDYAKASLLSAFSQKKDSFGKYYTLGYKYKYSLSAASYKVAYSKAPGITATYDGFTVSFGFNHVETVKDPAKDKAGTAYSATLETKEFAFADDMIKIQAAAEVSKTLDDPTADKSLTNVGASAKVAFAKDEISAKAAADFGFEGIGGDKVNVQFDASLAAAYDFVSATAYVFKGDGLKYASSDAYENLEFKNLYLEATLGADLSKFDVPVSVSFGAKNIIDKNDAGIGLSASVDYAADAIAAGASFSINTTATTAWSLNVYGIYTAELFTAGANVKYTAVDKAFSFGIFAESSTLVEGVTVGLNYGLASGYAQYYTGSALVADGTYNSNYFASGADPVLGTAEAYCIINF